MEKWSSNLSRSNMNYHPLFKHHLFHPTKIWDNLLKYFWVTEILNNSKSILRNAVMKF